MPRSVASMPPMKPALHVVLALTAYRCSRSANSWHKLGLAFAILGLLPAAACSRDRATASEKSTSSTSHAATDAPTTTVRTTASPLAPVVELPQGVNYVTGSGMIERIRETEARGAVVNVWASWCGPCRSEVPMLRKLQSDLGADALEFIFVSVDAPDKAIAALEFAKEEELPQPTLLAKPPLGDFKQAMTPRWRGSLPATFLFDAEGKLRYWWGAQVFEHEIAPILQGFLAGDDIDGEANFKIRQGGKQP